MKSIDIFPWNEHFVTGLQEVDEQHRVLVRLLNELASHIAFAPGISELNRILAALIDHTVYHFTAEERIWDRYLTDDAEKQRHHRWHQEHVETMRRLQAEQAARPMAQAVDDTLAYLSHWVGSHILEQDRCFALEVLGIREGLKPEAARARAAKQMQGATRALVDLILSTYGTLTANTVSLLREIGERKRTEDSLLESEARFRTIVEQSPVGIALSKDDLAVEINDACVKMFGYASREEKLGANVFDSIAPHCRAEVMARNRRRLQGEDVEGPYETVGLRKDGSEFPLAIVPTVIHMHGGPLTAAFLMDITERKRAEAAERTLHRTVKLLSRANSLLMRETDKQALLDGVCRLAVEVGGYRMAWVGYAQHDAEKSVLPVARFGPDYDYVETVRVSWADTPFGRGPTGKAIRSGRCVVAQDIMNDPDTGPWREAARERGFLASIALPLHVEHKVIGALVIYSGDTHAFGAEEVVLLEELAGDLAFGIEGVRLREAKDMALRNLKRESDKNRALLHNASDGVHVLDDGGRLIDASDSFCAMLGYARAELMGSHFTRWNDGSRSATALAEDFRRALDGRVRTQFHARHRRKDGSLIDVEVSSFPLTIEGRRVLFNSSRDVTESRRIRTELEQTTQDLRSLLADFESALEAERSHIAREVHDELGQILTSLGFAISTIRVKYGREHDGLLDIVREMSALNERALQVARNVAENLRPAMLDMGIAAAIEWLCGKTQAQTGMRCEFQLTSELGDMELGDMDQAEVDAVFRIVQESLTNAMRHARARRVSISLAQREDDLYLSVHDDGQGFDPARTGRSKSFGLRGMEERVRGMGGTFQVISAPGQGATVAVHMPYHRRGSGS